MQRWLSLCLLAYAPHLLEEHLTGMWNDPVIVLGFAPLAAMPARQASYLVFQIMLGALLVATFLWGRGPRSQKAILAALALGLLAESHHLIRSLNEHHYNSGLWSSLPMPALGTLLLWRLFAARPSPPAPALQAPPF